MKKEFSLVGEGHWVLVNHSRVSQDGLFPWTRGGNGLVKGLRRDRIAKNSSKTTSLNRTILTKKRVVLEFPQK